uniref:Translation elongation factor EF1B beta/delta subunit guanine nucleotide exchange domain-containing protein n=1 Tax=Physcomitrium patens TaxID=3218 RepID=A0A2K1LA32_PHYPA|nr:hypothetical protein PHYPA_001314 [Physcomitrium patens]
MATKFLNIGTKEGMDKLDELLGQQSFISGAEPSKDDLALYGALKGTLDTNYANLTRWYNHVNDILGSRFLGPSEGVVVGTILTPLSNQHKEDTTIVVDSIVNRGDVVEVPCNVSKGIEAQDNVLKKFVQLELKPWDNVSDLIKIEQHVRGIEMNGLFWGKSKFVNKGSVSQKLHIMMTIEDDKISPHDLIDKILGDGSIENLIQSCDILTFSKNQN